jgi:hypothetical protein
MKFISLQETNSELFLLIIAFSFYKKKGCDITYILCYLPLWRRMVVSSVNTTYMLNDLRLSSEETRVDTDRFMYYTLPYMVF